MKDMCILWYLLLMQIWRYCDNVDMFDASLFRMTAPEAAATDPQQRILLEETFMALHATNNLLNEPLSSHSGRSLKLLLHILLDSIH